MIVSSSMMMMMYNNKFFLVIVMAALLSEITAVIEDRKLAAPKSSKLSKKLRKSSKKGKSSKSNKKGKSPTTSPTSSLDAITDLVVFGDSLSDNGNSAQYFPCTDVYCGLRYSNGHMTAELVSDALGLGPVVPGTKPDPTNLSKPIPSGGNNYAFVGALANSDSSSQPFNEDTNDFATQVGYYVESLEVNQRSTMTDKPSIEAATLHFVYFGGNDIFDAIGNSDPSAFIAASVADMIQNIQFLADMGACSFLVLGPPNAGIAPIIVLNGLVTPATILSNMFSKALANSLELISITNKDPKCLGIQFFDTFTIGNEIYESDEFKVEFPDREAYCNARFVVPCDACNSVFTEIGLPPIPVNPNGICNCPGPILPEADMDFVCDGIAFFDEFHTTVAYMKMFLPFILAELRA